MDGRIEQVHQNPDVYKIEVPFENISTSATNCYVVKDGDDALVVDTGAPTDEGAAVLSAALDELAVDRDRAKWFLTHLHMDHAGLVDQVVPDGGFLLIGANEVAAVRASRTGMFLETLRRLYRRQGVPLASLSVAARLGIEVQMFDPARLRTLLLHDGDTVTVGRWEFKVVETPGHTPGHLSLFHPESRILFGGDHALFVISPSIALFADGQDGLQTYFDSMQKVHNLGISQLYHSHGPMRRLRGTLHVAGGAPRSAPCRSRRHHRAHSAPNRLQDHPHAEVERAVRRMGRHPHHAALVHPHAGHRVPEPPGGNRRHRREGLRRRRAAVRIRAIAGGGRTAANWRTDAGQQRGRGGG